MKAFCTLVLLCIVWFTPKVCFGQGFDWLYDARMPSQYPSLFVGAQFQAGFAIVTMDALQSKATPLCGNYIDGSSSGYKASVSAELWNESGLSSWQFALGLQTVSMAFNDEKTYTLYENEVRNYLYRFTLESKTTFIFAEGFFKHRIAQTHFHTSAGLAVLVALSSGKTRQYGEILEPIDKVSLEEYGEATDLSLRSFQVQPILKFGYDVDMGKNLYGTPFLAIGVPVFSSIGNTNVRNWQLNIGISVSYAMPNVGWY